MRWLVQRAEILYLEINHVNFSLILHKKCSITDATLMVTHKSAILK